MSQKKGFLVSTLHGPTRSFSPDKIVLADDLEEVLEILLGTGQYKLERGAPEQYRGYTIGVIGLDLFKRDFSGGPDFPCSISVIPVLQEQEAEDAVLS